MKGVVAIVLISLACIVSGQNENTRCMTGTRLTVQGFTAFDNAFPSICPPNTPYCVRYVYDQAIENNGETFNATAEFGECSQSRIDNCDPIAPFLAPFGEVKSCEAQSCNATEEPCFSFEFARGDSDCSVPEGDVRAFPGCTMREAINSVFECASPLIFNFPHDDDKECRNVLNEMVKCIGPKISSCLDSNCPSLFDGVPGMRSQYSEISFFASNTKTIMELVDFIRNSTGFEFQPIVNDFICTVDKDSVNEFINLLQANAFELDGFVVGAFPEFTCPDAFSRLQSNGFQFLRDFYAAQDKNQIFEAMRVSSEGIVEIFRNCNLNVIFNNFGLLVDGLDIKFDAEEIQQALKVAFEFASFIPDQPRPEECPAEGNGEYGLIRLNCMERFENATTKCQIRKRWACNFAEWRFNFLRTWLSKFYQRFGDRNLPVPSCGNDEEYIRCRSGNLCCYNAPRGCRVCFCTSHDYDNSQADIYNSWRASYRDWNNFFRVYQQFNSDNTCF